MAAYFAATAITILVLTWVFKLWTADITIPWGYQGDGLLASMLVKGVVDNGWIWQNPFLGMPGGQLLYDYPFLNSLDFLIFKLFSLFTKNYGLILNSFFLLTFPLTAITSMFVCRELKMSYITSIVVSVLFTFIPYHIFRGEGHLFLASYFMVPLMILVALWVYLEKDLLFKKDENNSIHWNVTNPKFLISVVICIVGACTFTYYPVFTCFFLLIAGFAAYFSQKNKYALLTALIFICVIGGTILVNYAPSLMYQQENGKNINVGVRVPWESELYGLKIIQIILPIYGHRIPFFSSVSQLYSTTSPLVTENTLSSIGFIGSLGFLFTFIWIFFKVTSGNAANMTNRFKILTGVSLFSVSAVLLATIGGFGTIFNYAISPQLRAYNRISIFIAFFALIAFFISLEVLRDKYLISKAKRTIFYGILIVILLGGIMDQTHDYMSPPYGAVKTIFQQDDHFIKQIESVMPENAMIFQLPYVAFPESPPVYNMTDYNHFRGYLHSEKLRWSYGAIRGRLTDQWQKEVTQKGTIDMVDNLSVAGFSGVYVNTDGYADFGRDITSNLSRILTTKPIVSDDGKLFFFDMSVYNSGKLNRSVN
ncbi:MAG: hypothetical protein ABSD81_00625 [Methanomicrobiales archaeon]